MEKTNCACYDCKKPVTRTIRTKAEDFKLCTLHFIQFFKPENRSIEDFVTTYVSK